MKKLLNTIYILTPGSYIHVRNQNIVVEMDEEEKISVPAHNIEAIVCFGQNTVSTPLIGFCGEEGISLVFLIFIREWKISWKSVWTCKRKCVIEKKTV